MPFYLTRFSYTPDIWARLTKKPEDRREAARAYIESVDNVSMAAVAIATSGGGALWKFETTPLLTVEETLGALRRADSIRYRPPGA